MPFMLLVCLYNYSMNGESVILSNLFKGIRIIHHRTKTNKPKAWRHNVRKKGLLDLENCCGSRKLASDDSLFRNLSKIDCDDSTVIHWISMQHDIVRVDRDRRNTKKKRAKQFWLWLARSRTISLNKSDWDSSSLPSFDCLFLCLFWWLKPENLSIFAHLHLFQQVLNRSCPNVKSLFVELNSIMMALLIRYSILCGRINLLRFLRPSSFCFPCCTLSFLVCFVL